MGEKEADPWVVPLPPPGVASTLPPSQGGRALANKTPAARPFGLQLTCACKGPASGLSPGASTRVSESVPAQSEADPQEGTPGGHCLPEGHQTKTHKPHRGGLPTRACRLAVLCPGVPASTRLSRLHRRDLGSCAPARVRCVPGRPWALSERRAWARVASPPSLVRMDGGRVPAAGWAPGSSDEPAALGASPGDSSASNRTVIRLTKHRPVIALWLLS